ncbi:MAG: UvrD-helicase domain-containing protein [Deltaproteobacteria bacterium]|nr:UvrD-helicase domain-containing protein [Deltaproteobacteria bacterium]
MKFIADLHIHSHFSRATSRDLMPERLSLWAQKKGISLIGTGDFTHPGWVAELKERLVDAEEGLFRLRPELEREVGKEVPNACRSLTRFILSGEISCIYKRGEKTRKIHHLILMPDFEAVERLNRALARVGNITSDGRPILGLDSRNLLEIVLEADERAFFIPAHIWTPWFSLFGSKSGFDTIEECFGDLTPHIHALETGLSSDPPMNRCLSAIDGYLLVSNSDAHSPAKLGREANLFDTTLGYAPVVEAMSTGDGFLGTIEFFPEEGKYHLDGHRKCGVRYKPDETRNYRGICPRCGKPLTVGVLHRVHELGDRKEPRLTKDFFSLIPLPEILSEILSCGPATSKVLTAYEDLLERLGPELPILMDCALEEVRAAGGPLLAEAIGRMRRNQVIREEGYDGEYGVIRLFHEGEKKAVAGQGSLFKPPGSVPKARKRSPMAPAPVSSGTSPSRRRVKPDAADPILAPLNPEQKKAVLHEGGHLLILAGPGTGKTLTLTHRIAHLIRTGQAQSGQVLALTFTNKAAREMKNRLAVLLSGLSPMVRVSTFHSLCLDLLRQEGNRLDLPEAFSVCPEADASLLARQVVSETKGGRRRGAEFLKNLSVLKRASLFGITGQSLVALLPLFREYQQRLRNLGMLDTDDLEVETLRLYREHQEVAARHGQRFPWIFVDEYQDTNAGQAEILKAIVGSGRSSPCTMHPAPCTVHLSAIGDPDQAIYGFRGSDVSNFLHFGEDFPGAREIVLSRNYRSTQAILDSAAAILQKAESLKGHNGPGEPILVAPCRSAAEESEMIVAEIERIIGGISYFSLDSGRVASHEEGQGLGFGDVAVLFRLNAQGDALEKAFSRSGIPYVRSGEKPLVARYPVNVLWRFLQALRYPDKPHYRDAYLALPKAQDHDGPSILTGCKAESPVRETLEQAIALHGFDLSDGQAEEALRRLRDLAASFQGDLCAFLDLLSLDRGIDHETLLGDRVALMSLHAAKGLEWPVVFITGCEDQLLPCALFGDRDDEEEKRLLYVGMTRARRLLILSHARRRTLNGRPLEAGPSPFLKLIPKELTAALERSKGKHRGKTHRQLGLFQ